MPGSVVSLSGCGVALFVLLLLPNPIRLILNEFLTLQSYTRGTVDLARPVQHSLLRVWHRTLRPLGPSCSTSTPSLLPSPVEDVATPALQLSSDFNLFGIL